MSLLTEVPDDPLPLALEWLEEAIASGVYNPWAMALATVDGRGRPACRYVLLKSFDAERGCVAFYTNYGSRKALELDSTGRAAAAFYWPLARRQLRVEGRVTRSPAAESDAYFATRPRQSQLNAWASAQSRELPEQGLEPAFAEVAARFPEDRPVPRPEGWGGYRIWLDTVEFWIEGVGRFHERVDFRRELTADAGGGFSGGNWRHVRLQP